MKYLSYLIILLAVFSSCSSDKKKQEASKPLGKFIYVDRGRTIHSAKNCNAIYKEHNATSVDVIPPRYVWAKNGLTNICSQCVTDVQIEQLDSITSSLAYINRLWLFDILHKDFDNDWTCFNAYLDSRDKREDLYNNIKDKYDLDTFEEFDEYMTDYKKLYYYDKSAIDFERQRKLHKIYDILEEEGYTPPNFWVFIKDMEDDNNLKGVWNTLKKEGYKPSKFEKFKKELDF